MNIVRTIPQYETPAWIDLLFRPGHPLGPKDPDPLTYPFSVRFNHDLAGGFLYARFRGNIIGYARIARVEAHSGDTVGEEDKAVSAGDRIVLESPLLPLRPPLPYPGPFRWKYEKSDLHEAAKQQGLTG